MTPPNGSVLHVIPHLGKPASGPAYSVGRLCDAQAALGVHVAVATLDKYGPASRSDVKVLTFATNSLVPRLCMSRAMRRSLPGIAAQANVMHSHGLWLMPHLYASATAKALMKPIVISPRGGLSPWARDRSAFFKRIVSLVGHGTALRDATAFHATSESELADIRSCGFRQPIFLVPNGVDLQSSHVKQAGKTKRLLFLARIHPTKGLDLLLRAWREVEAKFPAWSLTIAGPDCIGHLGEMVDLRRSLGLSRVDFVGAVFGAKKFELLADADLYILPSHTENFGLTVAEALSVGTPAVVGKGAPWSELDIHRAGWWIDLTVDSLVRTLTNAMALPAVELKEMGQRGRRWIERDFCWPSVAERMTASYSWLLGNSDRPEWVYEA